ncbi:MAG TPA: pyridoxamine 5'-phosphate oxidase family protein, partial [Myxococcota bacterium]|nr:pyridoxamine 5'-phosphate oxidase family protein [Myxococcota bacterium]
MTEQRDHLLKVLRNFSRAMLTTRHQDGSIHTRPMVIAQLDDDGTAWLMADDRSEKISEIEADAHASLSFQSRAEYATLSGEISLEHDREQIRRLFQEPWKTYFPHGPEDPHIVLLKLSARLGEFWDNAGIAGIRYVWEAASAYVKGERPHHDDQVHA